ncbi:MAG: hypothetical protein WBN29_07910 [Polyangiales bacterium]
MLRHLRRAFAYGLLVGLLVAPLCLGCAEQPSASPQEVVSAFFGAVASNDCAGAVALLDGLAKERFEGEGCNEALEALRRKQFEQVLGAQVDGRDERMHLVRVRFIGERETVLIGVRKTRRGHRIVSF